MQKQLAMAVAFSALVLSSTSFAGLFGGPHFDNRSACDSRHAGRLSASAQARTRQALNYYYQHSDSWPDNLPHESAMTLCRVAMDANFGFTLDQNFASHMNAQQVINDGNALGYACKPLVQFRYDEMTGKRYMLPISNQDFANRYIEMMGTRYCR